MNMHVDAQAMQAASIIQGALGCTAMRAQKIIHVMRETKAYMPFHQMTPAQLRCVACQVNTVLIHTDIQDIKYPFELVAA